MLSSCNCCLERRCSFPSRPSPDSALPTIFLRLRASSKISLATPPRTRPLSLPRPATASQRRCVQRGSAPPLCPQPSRALAAVRAFTVAARYGGHVRRPLGAQELRTIGPVPSHRH